MSFKHKFTSGPLNQEYIYYALKIFSGSENVDEVGGEGNQPSQYDAPLLAASPALYALLRAANCPECDGSGTKEVSRGYDDDGYQHFGPAQCQWCHERNSLIQKLDKNQP